MGGGVVGGADQEFWDAEVRWGAWEGEDRTTESGMCEDGGMKYFGK